MPKPSAFFLTPEPPQAGSGGGGLRSASLLEYLKTRYDVDVFAFTLPHHSKSLAARAWRNGWRFVRGAPPLLDRFSGFESQLAPVLAGRRYNVAVIEHFWCAPYAAALRPHCGLLVLDLHNVESRLATTHSDATRGAESLAFSRFATAYENLEREWLPQFDVILTASVDDASRIASVAGSARIIVYPNALPEIASQVAAEHDSIAFSGNLEYHPNVEAVRWFGREIWPILREAHPTLVWKIIGRNEHAIRNLVENDSCVRITGPVDDAIATIAQSKVVVVPLLSGSGTRFKILEAWAAGRAVVSTNIGAEGLLACPGQHLVLADEPQVFAAAVTSLLENPDKRRQLGEAGRRLYADRYTWPAAWKCLEDSGI